MIRGIRNRLASAWANLSLRGKGLVVVAIPLAALLAAVLSFYLLQRQQQVAETRVKRTLEIRDKIQQVQGLLLAEETSARATVLARLQNLTVPNPSPFPGGRLSTLLTQLQELLRDDPVSIERVTRVKKLVEEELSGMAQALAVSPGEQLPPGRLLPERAERFLSRSALALNELQLELAYMLSQEDRNLTEFTERAQRVRRWNTLATAAGGVFGLGIGLLAVLLFTSGIVQRVQRSAENAHRLAEGLPLLPMPRGADEVGRLGLALEETRTLLEQREEAILRAKGEAERANQAKSAFLANVSHELRTPLNAIIGFTRLVLRKTEGQIPAQQHDNLQKVLISAEHLLNLINGLLDLSKIEAGKMEVFVESIVLQDVIDAAVLTVQPTLKNGVILVKDLPSDMPSHRDPALFGEFRGVAQQVQHDLPELFLICMQVDGEDGIRKAEQEKPDLILMDLALPVLDGWEATRRIKGSRDLRAIPVIAITSHAMIEEERKARQLGCDDYLTKPINEDLLRDKIRKWIAP